MAWGRSNFDGQMRIWLLLIAIIVSFPALADPTTLTGTVTKVRDGDTIWIGATKIRLHGIDALETRRSAKVAIAAV